MIRPEVIVGKSVSHILREHICATGFQYETGGVLLGYRCLRIFYVSACTFPRCGGSIQATKMSFVLDGKEHAAQMEKIREEYFFAPKLIGIWHSHTAGDNEFSMQDKESNSFMVKHVGEILSVIITQKERGGILFIPYYLTESGNELLCRSCILDN